MNIIDLLQSDGITPIHASRNEWHSSCPECGGMDRFSCWPEKVNSNGRYLGGRFVCRGCGFSGDAVAYLMKRRAMTFMQAVKQLGIDPGQMPERTASRAWQPEPPKAAPGAAWQARARAFVDHCTEQLKRNSEAVAWLQQERGLNPETIKAAGLGWNDRDLYQARTAWGLPEEMSQKTGKPKRLWLPGGLVIPWQVIRLRIRRDNPGTDDRYINAAGSSMAPMVQWTDQAAVAVVESELDGLLVSQEAGELIGVVALGSATMKPDELLHRRLMEAERILVSLDSDSAGAKAAWGFWTQYPNFKRWPVIRGKDVCEQWKSGVDVRMFIQAGLCE